MYTREDFTPKRQAGGRSPLFWAFIALDALLVLAVAGILAMRACSPAEPENTPEASYASQQAAAPEPSSSSASSVNVARLEGLVEDGEPAGAELKLALAAAHPGYAGNVVELYQGDELPSGCEIVSLAAALASSGVQADPAEIADSYLVVNGDYEYGYIASPRGDNGGGFPPGIADAANAYLADAGSSLRAHDLTGSSFESLAALAQAGYPVLVWTTLDLSQPVFGLDAPGRREADGEYVWDDEDDDFGVSEGQPGDWYINEHCVAMYGVENGLVTVSDPLEGITAEDADLFREIYEACGSMALYLR